MMMMMMVVVVVESELYFHEQYGRSQQAAGGTDGEESASQCRYRAVCRAVNTCSYVSVLLALATDDVTLANERLSANAVLALALALEVTSSSSSSSSFNSSTYKDKNLTVQMNK